MISADRHKVGLRVERQILVEPDVKYDVAQAADDQRVAIRRRCGDRPGAGDAAGAGPVLDNERLPHPFGELIGHEPPQQVIAAGRGRPAR